MVCDFNTLHHLLTSLELNLANQVSTNRHALNNQIAVLLSSPHPERHYASLLRIQHLLTQVEAESLVLQSLLLLSSRFQHLRTYFHEPHTIPELLLALAEVVSYAQASQSHLFRHFYEVVLPLERYFGAHRPNVRVVISTFVSNPEKVRFDSRITTHLSRAGVDYSLYQDLLARNWHSPVQTVTTTVEEIDYPSLDDTEIVRVSTTTHEHHHHTSPPIPGHHSSPPMPGHHTSTSLPGHHASPPMPGHKTSPPLPGHHTSPPMPGHHTSPPMPGHHTSPPMPGHHTSTPLMPGHNTSLPMPGHHNPFNQPGFHAFEQPVYQRKTIISTTTGYQNPFASKTSSSQTTHQYHPSHPKVQTIEMSYFSHSQPQKDDHAFHYSKPVQITNAGQKTQQQSTGPKYAQAYHPSKPTVPQVSHPKINTQPPMPTIPQPTIPMPAMQVQPPMPNVMQPTLPKQPPMSTIPQPAMPPMPTIPQPAMPPMPTIPQPAMPPVPTIPQPAIPPMPSMPMQPPMPTIPQPTIPVMPMGLPVQQVEVQANTELQSEQTQTEGKARPMGVPIYCRQEYMKGRGHEVA